jgi:hypothetical protein
VPDGVAIRCRKAHVVNIIAGKPPALPEESPMKIRLALATTLVALSTGAWAFHCPMEMKKIDEALAKQPALSAEQMNDVKKLRAEGETLHKAGKHQESLDALGKAEKILGI